MKKFVVLLGFLLVFMLVACDQEETFDPDKNLDLANVFFDDFNNGIDKNIWQVPNEQWGINNGGVIHQNVHYTEDGVVILQANGDYYDGDLKGINRQDGKRTGARINTRESLGPGRYEVRMKVMPRFGSTTAMWNFYYENPLNQEIDIELNVQNNFRVMMTTNWITEKDYQSKSNVVDVPLNDFEWHVFRYDWHTNPERVDYYLDGELVSSQSGYVPTYSGTFNIGNWFPDAWAGVPDFETDYTYVDWFKFTPFLNNDFVKTPDLPQSPDGNYPTEPIDYPIANLISNAEFEGDQEAWRRTITSNVDYISGEGFNQSTAIAVPENDITYQFITGLDDTFEMYFSAFAKLGNNTSGQILFEFYPLETTKIDQYVLNFSNTDEDYVRNEYYQKEYTFALPVGTRRVEISLIGVTGTIYFDNLFFNLSKKLKPTYEIIEPVEKEDFYDGFDNGIDPLKWEIGNTKWGTTSGGVIYQNVGYTEDGYAVLTANGDLYEGPLVGINTENGKRTGSLLTTLRSFGPGSFEVKAKPLPVFGATTAFWTFYYANGGNVNHEIDIELNVENDFKYAWFTNWVAETIYSHETVNTNIQNDDGNWHTYRFDWHRDENPRVEYYIDDILFHTSYEDIPFYGMRFNIGLWFPNGWAGTPNFETDYMLVDHFKYEQFAGHEYTKTANGYSSPQAYYPTAPLILE